MKLGYDEYYNPIELDVETHCHMLVVGSSGSGKTYAWWYFLGRLLQENPNLKVTISDFKREFDLLEDCGNYYGGLDAYDGIMEFYQSFCKSRDIGKNQCRHLLVLEEYAALISYLTMADKANKTKKANEIMAVIAEILMLGRSLKYSIWVIMQRADAAFFSNGARDNFMAVIGLGSLSSVQWQMLFNGEEIPNKRFGTGQGIILADGQPLHDIYVPKIKNIIEWNRHMSSALKRHK